MREVVIRISFDEARSVVVRDELVRRRVEREMSRRNDMRNVQVEVVNDDNE